MNKVNNCKHTRSEFHGIQETGSNRDHNLVLHNCLDCDTTIVAKKIPKVLDKPADKNNNSEENNGK